MKTERILVVPTAALSPYLTECGLLRGREAEIMELVSRRHLFLPRPEAEQDPAYRQIIPYIALCRGDEVFCTRRLSAGGEKRLHGLLSLGLGGHINTDDDDAPGIFERGLHRELSEEARFTAVGELTPRGVINDESSEVSRVHLGFFFTLEVTDAAVRETEKLEGLWVARAALPSLWDRLEGWGRIVAPVLTEMV